MRARMGATSSPHKQRTRTCCSPFGRGRAGTTCELEAACMCVRIAHQRVCVSRANAKRRFRIAGVTRLALAPMPSSCREGSVWGGTQVRLNEEESEMSQRFMSNVALAVAGAVVVVSTQAFATNTAGWVTFGVSLGALALLAMANRERAGVGIQWILDAEIALLALWSAVASVVYSGETLKWLSFAEGLAFVGLGIAGLILHEVRTERVVHWLEAVFTDSPDQEQRQVSA